MRVCWWLLGEGEQVFFRDVATGRRPMLERMPHSPIPMSIGAAVTGLSGLKKEEGEDLKLGGGHTGEPRRSLSGSRYGQNILHRGMKFSRKNIILKIKLNV